MALQQGRFAFHHDSVSSILLVALESFLSSKNLIMLKVVVLSYLSKQVLNCQNKQKKLRSGLLHLTADWNLLSDVGDKLVFPSFIAISHLRPGIDSIVFYS